MTATGPQRTGLVGYGEVGRALQADAASRGVTLTCYDPRGRRRGSAATPGLEWAQTVEEFADRVDLVVIAVPGDQAVDVADAVCPALRSGTVYSDWTTKSPADRDDLAALAAAASLQFVDVAIVDTVTWVDREVEVLASGVGAPELARQFDSSRFRVNVIDPRTPVSAEVKLCRSVMLKGLGALLIESLVVAERVGITDVVVAGLDRFMNEDFARIRDLALATLPDHVGRRGVELRAAAAFVRSHVGAAPMSTAAAEVFDTARDALRSATPVKGQWRSTLEALERAAGFGGPGTTEPVEVLP